MKQAMRHLAVVTAVFMSWTLATPPSSFAADAMSQRFDEHGLLPPDTQRAAKSVVVCAGPPQRFGMDRQCDLPGNRRAGSRRATCVENTLVVLRPVYPNSPVPKPRQLRVTLHYGVLALRFIVAPKRPDSLCTLVSQRGALPVISNINAGPGNSLVKASRQVAASVTTATLDIIPTRTDIHRCNFFLMRVLDRPTLNDSTRPLPNDTNECYLNELRDDTTNGLTARWSIPGFDEYIPDEHGVQVYKTRALTYYTDLNSLLATRDVSSIDSTEVDQLENYIHHKIIENLPAITPIGLAQVVFGA
ncbi:MAG: hypothetical protein JO296_01170 [Pseudonocardiales bacterium]|nr:hypothetical protein [Pseudonocardiales bacterium]